jgi:hypothetical protein
MAAPLIKSRQIVGDKSRDLAIIELLSYNEKSGARKSIEVGRALLPLGDGAGGYTTNASTAPRVLPSAGRNLAIYNNAGAVGAVTVGDNTMTAQAPGAVQVSGTNQFVGVPCMPNSWTYLSAAQWNYVAATAATLLVFLIDDDTYIIAQPPAVIASDELTTAPSGAPVNEPNT